MRLQVEPEAERDLQSAHDWYESEQAGLGVQFLHAVEAAFAAILRRPETFSLAAKDVRRAPTRRFPYGIFYLIEANAIVVIAVLHAKRNPKLWLKRRHRS